MVRDGYYYGLTFIAAGILLGWLAGPGWAVIPFLLAAFFLQFFRDPERVIPREAGAVVSPGDGKVTDVVVGSDQRLRISIFLSVFNVHVNRSPISGVLREVKYVRGKFVNAMSDLSADQNEQNIAIVEGDDGQRVVFKQIAGLLARRIVFTPKVGDRLERGQRVGMIKFGSRVDVLLDASARPNVRVGDHVAGGSTVLAYLQPRENVMAGNVSASEKAH
ncbi:MAG TPA: phosphatidylserine decarboxylase [Candidatus Sulfotelmatobacter sp.]|nr:phosphatidylserine decarboxylase [Candidatus Sulfotelmatobacter sp.]